MKTIPINLLLTIVAVSCIVSLSVFAQTRPTIHIDELPVSRQEQIQLGSQDIGAEVWNRVFGQTWVRNVNSPVLYSFKPSVPNGKAVIVVPGGGYLFVSIDNEGFRVAEKLTAQGYTVFVLKYRTNQTPQNVDGFKAVLAKNFGNLGKKELADFPAAVDDLANAFSKVAAMSETLNIDKKSISVIGFSAGARTLIRLIEQKPEAKLIGSAAFIYPPMNKSVKDGPRPPMFFAMATDDPLFTQNNLSFIQGWLAESADANVHLFANGGHGFGVIPKGTLSDMWWDNYIHWLNTQ